MIKYWIVFLCIFHCLPSFVRSADNENTEGFIRLAVLPEDSAAESRSLAELLTVRLSQTEGLEVVERAEIDRVLAEHELTASGMVLAEERIVLGRLLGAQGLAFVAFDAEHARWVIRLAETRRGFLAGLATIPHAEDGNKLETAVQSAYGRLLAFVPKLTIDTEQHTLVSLLRFNDARLLPSRLPEDHIAIGRIFPVLLAETLSAEPGILMLERRQLGDLRDEVSLTADDPAFKISGILIEGELGLPLGVIQPDDERLLFTVRFLDPARREIKRYEQPGTSEDLNDMLEATASGTVSALSEMVETPADDRRADEVATLLNLARRHNALWAADAAYALDPENQEARDTLIPILIKMTANAMPPGNLQREEILKRVTALARAERLCRESNQSFSDVLFPTVSCLLPFTHFRQSVHNKYTRSDSEIRNILQPVRTAIRNEIKESTDNTLIIVNHILRWGFFIYDGESPRTYVRRLFDMVLADDSMSDDHRDLAIRRTIGGGWPVEIYEELTRHPDPMVRFFANIRLLRMYFLPEQRRPYALGLLHDLDNIIMRNNAVVGTPVRMDTHFNQALDTIIALFPDEAARIHQLAFDKMRDALSRRNIRPIRGLELTKHLLNVAPQDALQWIDAVETIAQTNTMQITEYEMGIILKDLGTVKELVITKLTVRQESDTDSADIIRRVMLTPDHRHSQWRLSWPADLRDAWQSARIVPQRLLLEDDIMWIAVGGLVSRQFRAPSALHGCALIQIDLKTGRILSLRGGARTASRHNSAPWVVQPHIVDIQRNRRSAYVRDVLMLPIFRWHDMIVVPQGQVGIMLYPAESGNAFTDLRQVEVVDERYGLLSTTFLQVRASDDSLFILSKLDRHTPGQLLMRWNRHTKTTTLLFDQRQETHPVSIQEDSPTLIRSIEVDDANRMLRVLFSLSDAITTDRGLVPQRRLACWGYGFDTGEWNKLPNPDAADVNPGEETPIVWPVDEPMPYGFVNWNDGTLGITGFGSDWKIENFTRTTADIAHTVDKAFDHEQPDLLDQVVNAFDPKAAEPASLEAFLNSLIQKKRDGLPITERELQQSVESLNRYCRDIAKKHGRKRSVFRAIELQHIPPPDNTDVYLNSVRMALVHYPGYGIWLNPRRNTAGPNALPDMIRRLQSEFDPVLLLATVFPSLHKGDVGHAVRAVETLWEADPFLARKVMLLSTGVRPHDAWMSEYYLERGRDKEALRAAAMLGDTQTQIGLQTQAAFLDKYGDLEKAERLFIRAENKFGFNSTNPISDRTSLADFYSRRRDQTDASGVSYARKLDELRDRYFPEGMRRVTLADFRESPRAGARFTVRTILSHDHGINQGDVIVAVDGIQVDTVAQYFFVRDLDASNPRMELILWNGDEYVDVVTDLKDRRFRLRFDNYEP